MSGASLLAAVQAALGSAVTLGYASTVKAHDVYEAYVLTLLLEAARDTGWLLDLRDTTGAMTSKALFRLGPGRLASGLFTHVHMTRAGNQDLEVHLGVKVSGKSARKVSKPTACGHLLHEFDLLVLPATVAARCRRANADPAYTDVVLHAETKFYTGNLTLPLGRAAVGMAVECDLADKSLLVTNRIGFAVQDLVEHHDVTFRFCIQPSNPTGEYHLRRRFELILAKAP